MPDNKPPTSLEGCTINDRGEVSDADFWSNLDDTPEPGPAIRPLREALLWDAPVSLIETALDAADGSELVGGKVFSPRSSSALALNAFAPFFGHPERLPPLPGLGAYAWPAQSVTPERKLQFPFPGRRPNIDVAVETADALIAIEAKRFEPFDRKAKRAWQQAYLAHDWGTGMRGLCALRDERHAGRADFQHLDDAQLVRHAFGLWTATQPGGFAAGKQPVLIYLYARPATRPGLGALPAATIPADLHAAHATEIERFRAAVADDVVRFLSLSYTELFSAWRNSGIPQLRAHAAAVPAFFNDLV